jgi:hypothetical protein
MPRSNECPRCGAYVGQFAAGCSICGADLELLRRRPRMRVSFSFSAAELGEGTLLTGLMLVVALFAPLYGMGLAGLVFFDRLRRGHRTMRNLAAAAFALALIAFFVPTLPYGRFGPVG